MPFLARLAALQLGLQVVHVLDHARQGRATPAALTFVGALGAVVWVAVFVLARRRSPYTQPFTVLVGFATFSGFLAVHVLPHWSGAFSDPYAAAGVDAISWITLALPALVALWAGLAALPLRRTAVA